MEVKVYNFDEIIGVLQSDTKLMDSLHQISKYDLNTYYHSYNVCITSAIVGGEFMLSKEDMKTLIYGSAMHDIGKTKIDISLLNYPGQYNNTQFNVMKTHTIIGYDMCQNMGFSEEICNMVVSHHENIDGSGYPYGKTNADLNILTKILHVADVFNALVEKRPYKDRQTIDSAIQFIQKMEGKMFDKEIAEAFIYSSDSFSKVIKFLQDKYKNALTQRALYNNIINIKEK